MRAAKRPAKTLASAKERMMEEARWREALLEMIGARGGPDWGRAGAAAILLDGISRVKNALGAAMWTLWACVVFSFAAALPAWWLFTMSSAGFSARGVGLGALSLGWIVLWAFLAFQAMGMARFAFGGKAVAGLAALAGACACAAFAWSWSQAHGGLAASLKPWIQWGGWALVGSLAGTIALNKTLDAWLGAPARFWLAMEWKAWIHHLSSQRPEVDWEGEHGLGIHPQKSWPMKPEHLEWRALACARGGEHALRALPRRWSALSSDGLQRGRSVLALEWIAKRVSQGKIQPPALGMEALATGELEEFCRKHLGAAALAERERLILSESFGSGATVRGAVARL